MSMEKVDIETKIDDKELSDVEPVDLTSESNEIRKKINDRKKKRVKKFESLNISEEEMEERRRSANDLERRRMKKMSEALDDLRKCIPQHLHLYHRRMSKIRTLRLATSYIRALSDMLQKDIMREMVQNAYRNIQYNLIQSPVVYPGITVNVAPSPTTGTPNLGHSYHTPPRRQLNFSQGQGYSPSTQYLPTPDQTLGPHPAYQTPIPPSIAFYRTSAQRRWHTPSHTLSSPPEEDEYPSKPYEDPSVQGDGRVPDQEFSGKMSCRYGTMYVEGVYPLPDSKQSDG
ncbi:hypothetical protein FSP39_025175 [Pinctada imbricata]|uniref:BHLH domain-containing protein n=1 Tax=Pinctada imbricata TaxID=66713 RepID=A0AA88YQ00_PINIB|nr:hypothetical protein FSP39_025175 [Pinctada imbricata]